MNTKCTNWSWNISNIDKIFQMAVKYINLTQSKTLQNLPKLGFLVWKQTIWQPWSHHANKLESGAIQMNKISDSNLCQGCQIVYFRAKKFNSGKFWGVLQWRMLIYFMANWYILRPICIFYGQWVYFMATMYILWPIGVFCGRFGMLCPDKSGSPDLWNDMSLTNFFPDEPKVARPHIRDYRKVGLIKVNINNTFLLTWN
jgi:hypothetical protein